jgi:hypothetical protein
MGAQENAMHALPGTPSFPLASNAGATRSLAFRRRSPGALDPLQADSLGDACDLDIEMGALLRFKSMMALDGETVQVARMCYDTDYAHERIAQAHASGRDPLQRLALELFQAYHRRSAFGRPASSF